MKFFKLALLNGGDENIKQVMSYISQKHPLINL